MRRTRIYGRFVTWTTILLLVFNLMGPGAALGYTEISRTSSEEQVAEGVKVETIKIQAAEGSMNVYVTTVDLTNPYVKVDTLVGTNGVITKNRCVSNLAKDAGAVAAINADFFQMKEHAPIGITVQSGEMVTSPALTTSMNAFGLTKDGRPVFGIFGFQGTVQAANGAQFQLSGVNKPTYLVAKDTNSDVNRLNMYTPRWGAKSRGALTGLTGLTGLVEMVVENDQVRELRTDLPGTDIPANGYVLAGHGAAAQFLTTNFQIGDYVQTSYTVAPETDNLAAAVGGQAILVQDGKRHWFSNNIRGNLARNAIGASQDGKTLYLVVVDGGSASRGMSQEELADFMISIGAWTALNLDGGGSATLAARHLGDQAASLINNPVYTSERSVPVGLGIFSTAPPGDLAGLLVAGPKLVLVGTQRSFTVKGYDEHFNPYTVSPENVTWEVTPNRGEFNGSTFTAKSSGDAVIKAVSEGIAQEYPVKILGSSDIARLDVTPSAIAVNPGDSVDLGVKVTTKQGAAFTLQPGEFTVSTKGDIGTVNGARFTAGSSLAVGELEVRVDSTTAAVKVSVGGTEKPFYGFETAKDIKFRGLPEADTTGSFRNTTSTEPTFRGIGAGRLEYDFTKTSELRIAYGTFNGGLELSGQPLGIRLWVLGDQGHGHWLRARITGADGKEKLLDLAREVDWKGWQQVSANIPGDVKLPVKLTDIYLVETDGGSQDKGVIYFDELSLLAPPTADEPGEKTPEELSAEAEVVPGAASSLKLGQDLTLNFTTPAEAPVYSITARQIWKSDLPTPGSYPVFPMYSITGMADGDDVSQLPAQFKIKLKLKDQDTKNIKLMYWDEKNCSWLPVTASIDTGTGTLNAQTNRLGTFGLMQVVKETQQLPDFKDISGHWAREIIREMAAKKIVNGYPDGKFLPAKGVTRAEFVTMLVNAMGWQPETPEVQFKDVIPSWAGGSIAAAVNRGVVKGYDDGTFRAQKVINRAEMAVMLDKALALTRSTQPSRYQDADMIPAWAVQSVRNTKVTGIMQGSNNQFRPGDVANRAEAAAVMGKVLSYPAGTR